MSSTFNNRFDESEESHELQGFRDEQKLENFKEFYKKFELTDDITCGFGCLKGKFLQKFANKKTFAVLYGLLCCMFAGSFFYFNATISTIEKRFKIPSQRTGIISSGNDISQIFASIIVGYYTGKGHRPRWLGVSLLTLALFCVLNSSTYFIFGPGDDILAYTEEYDSSNSSFFDQDDERESLCRKDIPRECEIGQSSIWPQIILFCAQIVAGISASLYHTLGISYADDNITKSQSPSFLCFSLLFRMLGPAVGFGLASYCLKIFVVPSLHPTIDEKSYRWIGAWWIGWLVLAAIHTVLAFLVALYPRHLPKALARKEYKKSRTRLHDETPEPSDASFADMVETLKRLFSNRIQVLNNISAVFYYIGLLPYIMFLPKYLETVFTFSASKSSLITGVVEVVFSGLGMVTSGVVISKYKPRARFIAGYNVMVGAVSVLILMSFTLLGCPEKEQIMSNYIQNSKGSLVTNCSIICNCANVKFSPVCAPVLTKSFASPCHAGCTGFDVHPVTKKIEKYTHCGCISDILDKTYTETVPGTCHVQCFSILAMFLIGISVLKFCNASGRLPNLLILIRSVNEKDKPAAMGFGVTILSLFAFIPAPILFGYILDNSCLVWKESCSSKGHCWMYDLKSMRYNINITSAVFMAIGTLFDTFVWYYSKNLKIFDEKPTQIIRTSQLIE